MFKCSKCNEYTAEYDREFKQYICKNPDCKHVEVLEGVYKRCWRCGNEYIEYTWFHPSGCSKCDTSFVD